MNQKLPLIWQKKWLELGFDLETEIQKLSFLPLQNKKNFLGISPTGTGKTLAYLLPLLLNVEQGAGNQLLILLPTPELTRQVAQVAQDWAQLLNLQVISLAGGANIKRQIEKLKARPEILIGTSGRVLELIRTKKVKIMSLQTIVLDEVDLLLQDQEFNFANQILNYAPKDYQLVFVSATGDKSLDQVKDLTHNNLTIVDLNQQGGKKEQKLDLDYFYLQVPRRKRVDLLRSLNFVKNFRALVFFNQLSDLGGATEKLNFAKIPVASLASDQNKMTRRTNLQAFLTKKINLLLTTDLLARGLDFPNVDYVINFDLAHDPTSFVHRAGRVGRAGRHGTVITLVNDQNKRDYQKMIRKLNLTTTEIFLHHGKLLIKEPIKDK